VRIVTVPKLNRFASLLWISGVVLASALGLTGNTARADGKEDAKSTTPALYEVQVLPDIAYYQGNDADKVRHKLDLYIPREKKEFPVLLFIHGGAWTHGDKYFFGLYKMLGLFLARHGVGTVIANYRLSPRVTHPEHIKDVARAFAWTYRNIAQYGGRPDHVYICGHSAGGHLAALLATDDSYLKAEGLSLKAIKGVIPISGVYDIPSDNRLFDRVFGPDPKAREQASPVRHVRSDAPPFLIIYADGDFSLCAKKYADAFGQALRDHHATATTLEVKNRNHMTVLVDIMVKDDPAARALFEFIGISPK
jgi:acetyl esterase/lipase